MRAAKTVKEYGHWRFETSHLLQSHHLEVAGFYPACFLVYAQVELVCNCPQMIHQIDQGLHGIVAQIRSDTGEKARY
jgi:hypothetical protein